MRVTIKKIADIAGVSKSTVDRVLNNKYGVSQEMVEKVTKVADALGYVPNTIGRALKYQNKIIKIAVVANKNIFFDYICEGITAAANELRDFGVVIEYRFIPDFDEAGHVSALNDVFNSDVSGVLLKGVDSPEVSRAIERLKAASIPVVTVNIDVSGSSRLCYIGPDLVSAGRVAGNLMGSIISTDGRVVIVNDVDNPKVIDLRCRGFEEVVLAKHTHIRVAERCVCGNDGNQGLVPDLLRRYPDLRGIYFTGLSYQHLLRQAQDIISDKKIKIVCFDILEHTAELMENGVIDFVITQRPFVQGYTGIKMIFEYLYNKKVPEKQMGYIPVDIREAESIKQSAFQTEGAVDIYRALEQYS